MLQTPWGIERLLRWARPGVKRAARGLCLEEGSRVGVIGGGPAGSFFSYFLLDLARRAGLELRLDLYEARDFSQPGPAGCNMCGGIISESLVQMLATEGINLPSDVVERGLDSYVLHMDVGVVRIETPLQEMRIAGVHRGAGPRGIKELKWRSFDGYLLDLAARQGAQVIRSRVEELTWPDGRPQVKARGREAQVYDLLAGAVGVNSASAKLFEAPGLAYHAPATTKTFITEYHFGEAELSRQFGHSMHVFLLDVPGLEFAALIPKGDYLTFCLLGKDINDALVRTFLDTREVRQCLPPGWQPPPDACRCSPRINVRGAVEPFGDRLVLIGDCGVSRLYKDGIGAAYRSAKAAAVTAVFDGISREDFRRHYWRQCQAMNRDNLIGRLIFLVTRQIQRWQFARRAILHMVQGEQTRAGGRRRMSSVLWDTFTGSAPYGDVFLRTLHPAYWGRLTWEMLRALAHPRASET
jgi:flavin-dependent dehydrogenase